MSRFSLALLAGIGLVPAAYGATLVASAYNGNLYTLSFTGNKLSITSQATGCGTTPGWLEYYPDTRSLYCFDESWSGSGTMAQYSVGSDGKLTVTAQTKTTGNDVHGLLYGGPDNKTFIASAQYSPSTITTYKTPLANTKVMQLEKFNLAKKGPNSRQDVAHPHEVKLDPTGKFILNPDLGADIVRIWKIDQSSGKLTLCGTGQAGSGDGPRHIEFWKSAAGVQTAYTVNELGNSVSSWSVAYPSDPSGCMSLTRLQTLSTYAPGKKGGSTTKAAELRIAGGWLYATNRADQTFGSNQDSIAIYTIDPSTGQLAWQEAGNSYAYYPRTFQFNKDQTLVAVGGQTSGTVAIVERDPATGKLGKLISSLPVGNKGRAGEEDGLSAVVWIDY